MVSDVSWHSNFRLVYVGIEPFSSDPASFSGRSMSASPRKQMAGRTGAFSRLSASCACFISANCTRGAHAAIHQTGLIRTSNRARVHDSGHGPAVPAWVARELTNPLEFLRVRDGSPARASHLSDCVKRRERSDGAGRALNATKIKPASSWPGEQINSFSKPCRAAPGTVPA